MVTTDGAMRPSKFRLGRLRTWSVCSERRRVCCDNRLESTRRPLRPSDVADCVAHAPCDSHDSASGGGVSIRSQPAPAPIVPFLKKPVPVRERQAEAIDQRRRGRHEMPTGGGPSGHRLAPSTSPAVRPHSTLHLPCGQLRYCVTARPAGLCTPRIAESRSTAEGSGLA